MSMCEICQNWERVEDPYKIRTRAGIPLITNHHPNCQHYNESLMEVWCAEIDGNKCYVENEQDCRDTVGEEGWAEAKTSKVKIHREIYENLPEFEGF